MEDVDDDNCIDMTSTSYQPNQVLRTVDGPFKGYEAVYSQRRGEDRVLVLLNIMHRTQGIVLRENHVEANSTSARDRTSNASAQH